MQISTTETFEQDALVLHGRDRALQRPQGRERAVEAAAAGGFVAVALAMALFMPSPRALEPLTLILLMGLYVLTSRARFEIADGYTVPTELVLVPMLFLLPTPAVPLVVSVSWGLGKLFEQASGEASVYRAAHVFGDCWHAVGPALVIVLAGAQVFSWESWPVYVVALLAQFAFDFAATEVRARLLDGTPIRAQLEMQAPVYALDGALAPIGLLAAYAAIALDPAICLLTLPLAAVLAQLSHERRARIDQALELSSAYQGTAMLLGDVVEADDAYTGSHSRGVVELSLAVAEKMGLDSRQKRNV
ncbi:MAG TPA: hypothetical protein VNM89_09640, partial [Solirubrobacterales bacterium]|nr:hypothetical protein [Solirubrobacterales bacterium]